MELVGLIGSLAFSVVSVPMLLDCIRTRKGSNVSSGYLILTLLGNVCCLSYVIYVSIVTNTCLYPLYFNYVTALSIAILLTIAKIHWK